MIPVIKHLTIRAQLTLLVLAIILPVAVVMSWYLSAEWARSQAAIEDGLASLANMKRLEIEGQLEDAAAVLDRLAARPLVRLLDPQRCDPLVRDYVQLHPDYTQLGIRDAAGNIVCSHLPNPVRRLDAGSFPWFEEGLHAGGFNASGPFFGVQARRWVSVLTVPIVDSEGRVSGLAALPLDLRGLRTRLFKGLPEDNVIAVVDRRGRYLAHSGGTAQEFGQAVAEQGIRPVIPQSEGGPDHGIAADGSDGPSNLWAYVTVAKAGWRVFAGIPKDRAFAQTRQRIAVSVAIMFALFAFLLALARLVGSRIVEPIRGLAAAAGRVAEGDIAARAPVAGAAEIEGVARQFNRMLEVREETEKALKLGAERLQLAMEASRLALWDYDVVSGRVYLSESWSEMMGGPAKPTQTTFAALSAMVPKEDRATVRQAMLPALKGERPSYRIEHKVRAPSGEIRWIVSEGKVISRDARGRALRALGTNRDITERKLTEQSLRRQSELLRIGQSTARLIVLEWNIPEDRIEWSDDPGWLRGPPPASGKYPLFKDQIHPEDREAFLAARKGTLTTGQPKTFEYRIVRTDGKTLWVRSQHSLLGDAGGTPPTHLLAAILDISDYKQALDQIQFLAYQDALTGLPNRVLLRDRMKQAAAHAERSGTQVALLFIDLDNFKSVNDSMGHPAGDALLKRVAVALQECVRDTDTVSRHGGDEFIALLTDLPGVEGVTQVVEKLAGCFGKPLDIDGEELTVSASIGIALYPIDGVDFDTLLKKADTAMYRAKDAGRSTYRFYDQHMNVDSVEKLRLRNGLRSALEKSEFVLYYQPQIDLKTGAVIGAEALIRWNNPQRGLVPPGLFIPVAEESGLIIPVGDWVLREACRQAAAWRAAGLQDMVVAVNLSAIQFRRSGLVESVIEALERSGLHPAFLELELTESILIRDAETTLATLRRMKALGLRLSIDDFGTGYSSLSYLKRLAVDKLKIDQSFISNLATDPENAAIVRAIIQMARGLDLRTIAEGVEDAALLRHLRIFDCDEAQGYHFAHPMPATEFAAYLASHTAIPG